ncbi:MAG TPA: hypothetical protein VK096_00780 [Actinomycetales bacterium]|nr:hypothetical protein [Actinomycetales bacterium]
MATSLISMRDAVPNKREVGGNKPDAILNKRDTAVNRFEELP